MSVQQGVDLGLGIARPRRLARMAVRFGKGLVPFAVLLAIWEVAVVANLLPRSSFPAPQDLPGAFVSLVTENGLLGSVLLTLERVLLGGAIGLGVGLALGSLIALNRRVSDALSGLISFFQSVGEVGWLPVLLLWLGFNATTIVVTIAYTVAFPVFFGTVSGFETIPKNLGNSIRTLGGGRVQLLREVMLPGALPSIITGFRTGMGFGWRTVILAELLVGGQGLGVLLFEGQQSVRPDWIMVEMVIIGVIWLVLDGAILKPLERRTVERWGLQR
jgi:NitT/TauT family transport system permease protein/taurine transport system permease protein